MNKIKTIMKLLFLILIANVLIGCQEENEPSKLDHLETWVLELYENKLIDSDVTFPLTADLSGSTLTWETSHPDVLTAEGVYLAPSEDTEVVLTCTIAIDGKQKVINIPVLVKEKDEPIVEPTKLEQLEAWVWSLYNNKLIDENQNFPITSDALGGTIKWQSFDQEILTSKGIYTAPVVDTNIELVCTISVDEDQKMLFIPVVVKGSGTPLDAISIYLNHLIDVEVVNNVYLPQTHPDYPCSIVWESSRLDILDNQGNFTKPQTDISFSLKYTIYYQEQTKTETLAMVAKGLTDLQRAHEVLTAFDRQYEGIKEVTSDLNLDQATDQHQATLLWESSNPSVISSLGEYHAPLYDQNVRLTLTVKVGNAQVSSTYQWVVKGGLALNKWDQITQFLHAISKPEINTINQFYLFGSEAGYERVNSQNIGYLPFYDEEPMTIIQEIVPMTNLNIRPGRNRTETKFIVIHNTGMAAPTATAKQLSKAIQNSTRQASWHFSIDDKETYQQLGINEVGWHAGESNGNNYGIGIESCVYQGVDFNQVLRRLAKLTAKLLIDFDLGFEAIKQHFDFSGKNCPQVIREANRWDEFLDLVQIEYFAQTQLKDVNFVWESLTPVVLDNEGKVIHHPGTKTKVSYRVSVTYNNETRTFDFESMLNNL